MIICKLPYNFNGKKKYKMIGTTQYDFNARSDFDKGESSI
jgi:hypothetical protein